MGNTTVAIIGEYIDIAFVTLQTPQGTCRCKTTISLTWITSYVLRRAFALSLSLQLAGNEASAMGYYPTKDCVTIKFYECHIRNWGKHPIAACKILGQFAAMKCDHQKSNLDSTEANQSHRTIKSKFDSYWPTLLTLGVCSTLTSAHAGFMVPYPDAGTPVSAGQELFATGGDVTLTYAGQGTAAFSSYLFLVSPASPYNSAANPIFANQTTPLGTTLDLGAFLAGTELEFGIHVTYYGYGVGDWYTGPSSRNADNTVHAYLVNDYPTTGSTYVGFEDTQHGYADYNYQDFQFTATGLTTAVPEPSAVWSTALLGLFGVVWHMRSRTQQRPRQTE